MCIPSFILIKIENVHQATQKISFSAITQVSALSLSKIFPESSLKVSRETKCFSLNFAQPHYSLICGRLSFLLRTHSSVAAAAFSHFLLFSFRSTILYSFTYRTECTFQQNWTVHSSSLAFIPTRLTVSSTRVEK